MQTLACGKACDAFYRAFHGDTSTALLAVFEAPVLARPADAETIRSKAADFLKSYRDRGAGDLPVGQVERLPRSLSLAAGADIPGSELEFRFEELALDPWARSHVWQQQPTPDQLSDFSVVVIGAGMGA
jgi:4-hydroxyacetophenone monooxygenase